MMDQTLEQLIRKATLKEVELALLEQGNFDNWLQEQYAKIDAELAELTELEDQLEEMEK